MLNLLLSLPLSLPLNLLLVPQLLHLPVAKVEPLNPDLNLRPRLLMRNRLVARPPRKLRRTIPPHKE